MQFSKIKSYYSSPTRNTHDEHKCALFLILTCLLSLAEAKELTLGMLTISQQTKNIVVAQRSYGERWLSLLLMLEISAQHFSLQILNCDCVLAGPSINKMPSSLPLSCICAHDGAI